MIIYIIIIIIIIIVYIPSYHINPKLVVCSSVCNPY